MAARDERPAEGDSGKGVAWVAERGEEDAPPGGLLAQFSSATVRSMSARASAVCAIGVTISVPTPAER